MGRPATGTETSLNETLEMPTFWFLVTIAPTDADDEPASQFDVSRIEYVPFTSNVGSKVQRCALSIGPVPEQSVTGGVALSSPPSTYCSAQLPPLTLPITSVRVVSSLPSLGLVMATVGC